MKLDRSTNPGGVGKFILIETRKLTPVPQNPTEVIEAVTNNPEAINMGLMPEGNLPLTNQFFVLKLNDEHAHIALSAYAEAYEESDPEYAAQIRELAKKSKRSPNRKPQD